LAVSPAHLIAVAADIYGFTLGRRPGLWLTDGTAGASSLVRTLALIAVTIIGRARPTSSLRGSAV
jgi:hypothetical protein